MTKKILRAGPKAGVTTAATVKRFQKFDDASGAEALIAYRGYVFACSYLGRPSMTLIKPVSGTRIENRIAADVCEEAFCQLIWLNCSAEWLAQNAAMYAEETDVTVTGGLPSGTVVATQADLDSLNAEILALMGDAPGRKDDSDLRDDAAPPR